MFREAFSKFKGKRITNLWELYKTSGAVIKMSKMLSKRITVQVSCKSIQSIIGYYDKPDRNAYQPSNTKTLSQKTKKCP